MKPFMGCYYLQRFLKLRHESCVLRCIFAIVIIESDKEFGSRHHEPGFCRALIQI